MKAIVEWGHPKAATQRQICGINGQFVTPNLGQACKLASQLFHTMGEGGDSVLNSKDAWRVSTEHPRKVIWTGDNSGWVSVSLLDGVPRGPYAGIADRDYAERVKAAAMKGAPR